MLYLAEVQKKGGGFGIGGKTELKLLASQRSEQNWSASGDELIVAEEASKFNDGTLVLVELSASKKIQKPPQEASRQLVSILQSFSRLSEKYKTKDEEIETWQQSLTYQSQELNRREMELEARREELEQLQHDLDQLEGRRQELEAIRQQAQKLQEELQTRQQELDSAWERLRQERENLGEQQVALQQASSLNSDQANHLRDLIDRISGAILPIEAVREQLNAGIEQVTQQRSLLNGDGGGQHPDRAQQQQAMWQARDLMEQARLDWQLQQRVLELKQEYARALKAQIDRSEELHQRLLRTAETSVGVKVSGQAIEGLQSKSTEELQALIGSLEAELERKSRFVNDQEEELNLQRQEIDELSDKLGGAGEGDRAELEKQLADAQDCYKMLNETLVGQRRVLREQESILSQHRAELWSRSGNASGGGTQSIDIEPVLKQIEEGCQQQETELQTLEAEIERLRQGVTQAEEAFRQRENEYQSKYEEVTQLEGDGILQPLKHGLNELQQKLEAAAVALNQVQETGDYQLQAIAELQQSIQSLTN